MQTTVKLWASRRRSTVRGHVPVLAMTANGRHCLGVLARSLAPWVYGENVRTSLASGHRARSNPHASTKSMKRSQFIRISMTSMLLWALPAAQSGAIPISVFEHYFDAHGPRGEARTFEALPAAASGSNGVRAHLDAADMALRGGRMADAISELEGADRGQPSPTLKVVLGELYVRAARYEDAVRAAEEALVLAPDSVQPHDIIGTARLRSGDPEGAIRAYRAVVAKAPDMAIGYLRLGDAYWTLGQSEQALHQYQEAIKRDGQRVDAMIKRSAVLLALGRHGGALAAARAAMEFAPDDPLAASALGEAYLAVGEDAEAEAWFRRAVLLQPAFPYFQDRLAEILEHRDDLQGALTVYANRVAQDPMDIHAHRQLARLYRATGRGSLSEYHAGMAAFVVGDLAGAFVRYGAAVEADATFKGAYLDLAAVCIQLERWSDAIRAAFRAAELDPSDAVALSLLGQAYLGDGRILDAEQALLSSVRVDPDYAPAHLHLARLLTKLNRCADSARHRDIAARLGIDVAQLTECQPR